jgi:hypothetical protein
MKERICLLTKGAKCALRSDGGICVTNRTSLPENMFLHDYYRHIDCRHAIDAHQAVDEEVQE